MCLQRRGIARECMYKLRDDTKKLDTRVGLVLHFSNNKSIVLIAHKLSLLHPTYGGGVAGSAHITRSGYERT